MSDIDTAAVDGLKALDPKRPIREADIGSQFCRDAQHSCVPPRADISGLYNAIPVLPSKTWALSSALDRPAILTCLEHCEQAVASDDAEVDYRGGCVIEIDPQRHRRASRTSTAN